MSRKSQLVLQLLGKPEVLLGGEPVAGFRSTKARALLFFVATQEHPQARPVLATLFWERYAEANARANLRKTLTNLRHVAGPFLTITPDSVGLNGDNRPWLDVRAFESALDAGGAVQLENAVDLYRGDFLEGFYVEEATEFEAWLLAQRYRLRERFALALERLAVYHAGLRRHPQAIGYAQRLLALDPLREDAHRLLLSLFAENGQRGRALAQYEACARILEEELGVAPAAETTQLYENIRDGHLLAVRPAVAHNLPAPTTSFVGREQELARIAAWLEDPVSRLLAIVGPGGVGKTRLAQHASWNATAAFADGIWLVPLTPVDDATAVPLTIATVLKISFSGKARPAEQVVRFLRRKRLLLLLDNAEHLLSPTLADFLLHILREAPGVQLIVTSRQRLEMQAEQVLALPGLDYPAGEEANAPSDYQASTLFRQRAEDRGHPLPKTADAAGALHAFCRLVDGLPLALELAAALTAHRTVAEIVEAVRGNLGALATRFHDLPARHRSIAAVFDTSWNLLGPEERRVMRALAYFRGTISPAAAARVAGAAPERLLALAGRSLLHPLGHGRYGMHELLRQYAGQRLAAQPEEAAAVAQRHSTYFADYLAARETAIQGPDYLQARAELEAEIDNVRQAWQWAVGAGHAALVARSLETLHYFYFNTQGLFIEAVQRFQGAAEAFLAAGSAAGQALGGRLLFKAGVNMRMLGRLEEAAALLEQSLSQLSGDEEVSDVALATATLAVVRDQQGRHAEALRLAHEATALARRLDRPIILCLALNNLAHVVSSDGDYAAGALLLEESLELARAHAYPHGELSALAMLGVNYFNTGAVEKAEDMFEQTVARCREAGTQSRLAQAVNNLGNFYRIQGRAAEALPLLQEAMRLHEAVGQVHYAAFTGLLVGSMVLAQSHQEQAGRYVRLALTTAREIDMEALALNAIVLHAGIVQAQGQDEEALALLHFVAGHPAVLGDIRKEVRERLRQWREADPVAPFARAERKAAGWTLEEVTASID